MTELTIDPKRMGDRQTGIFVRAKYPGGSYDSYDIADLTKESLFTWLKSRGGDNPWAENTVAILLGHNPNEPDDRIS